MLKKDSNGRGRRPDATGRSQESHKHIRFYEWMLAGPAFRQMSNDGRAALIEFNRIYNGSNNGEINISVRQLARLINCSKNTANKVKNELIDLGFIIETQSGSFNFKQRHASSYALTQHAIGDKQATKDFMKIKRAAKKHE